MTKYTNLVGVGTIFCFAFFGCKQPKSDSSVSSSEESGTWSAECYLVAEGDDERPIQEVLAGKSVPMEQCPSPESAEQSSPESAEQSSPESAEQSSPDGSSLNLASPVKKVRAARAVISFMSERGPAMFARLGEGGLWKFTRIDGGSLLGGTRKLGNLGAGRSQEKLRLLAAISSRLDREVPLLDGFVKSILANSSPVFRSGLRNTNPEKFFVNRWGPFKDIVRDGEVLSNVMEELIKAGHGGREYSLAFQHRYLDAVDVALPKLTGGKNATYLKILRNFEITAKKEGATLPAGIKSNIPSDLAAKFTNYRELASSWLTLPAGRFGTKMTAEVSIAQTGKDLFMVHINIDPNLDLANEGRKLFPNVLAEVKKIFGDNTIIGNIGSPRVTILVKPGDQSILQKIADFLLKTSP